MVAAIHPKRHRTPLLIAGPQAEAVSPLLRELEMQLSVVGDTVGAAAAIKMIRSVMIKGIEALTLECFLAASRAGILEEVTASLKNNYPGLDWPKITEYNLERMATHGERRAAEMEESAATLRELGLDPLDGGRNGQAPARDGRGRQGRKRARFARPRPRRHARRHQRGEEG